MQKVLDRNYGMFGSRDVFRYDAGTQNLSRISFEEIVTGFAEDDFKEYLKKHKESNVKFQRNDLCFCGSGKKFKKCCRDFVRG